MTWRELRELLDKMSSEEQGMPVMIWSEHDCPRPIQHLHKIEEDIYAINGGDFYCNEECAKDYPKEDIELVLEEGEYCLKP